MRLWRLGSVLGTRAFLFLFSLGATVMPADYHLGWDCTVSADVLLMEEVFLCCWEVVADGGQLLLLHILSLPHNGEDEALIVVVLLTTVVQ
jgi:hypothetical protein